MGIISCMRVCLYGHSSGHKTAKGEQEKAERDLKGPCDEEAEVREWESVKGRKREQMRTKHTQVSSLLCLPT